jgi:hypothetical protein
MAKTRALTLIILRRPNPAPDLFHPGCCRYHVIAANDYPRQPPKTIRFHNGRGN